MIEIDGSKGEGGGQVLRSALTLSLLTNQPFNIRNIRGRRSKPGLRPQHLAAVKAAQAVGLARVIGCRLESQDLTFIPTGIHAGDYRFEIGTAGSSTLVLQTIFLALAWAGGVSTVSITGGTHVPWSPTFEYLDRVWLSVLRNIGYEANLKLNRAGFYPRGGGRIEAQIQPAERRPGLRLETRTPPSKVMGVSLSSNLPEHVASRQRERLTTRLAESGLQSTVEIVRPPSPGKGSAVFISTESHPAYHGFSALGERGKPAEQVADEAADRFGAFLLNPAVVDHHLADQLLIPLAFATGRSIFSIEAVTDHLRTNADVLRNFLDLEISIIQHPDGKRCWVEIDPCS